MVAGFAQPVQRQRTRCGRGRRLDARRLDPLARVRGQPPTGKEALFSFAAESLPVILSWAEVVGGLRLQAAAPEAVDGSFWAPSTITGLPCSPGPVRFSSSLICSQSCQSILDCPTLY